MYQAVFSLILNMLIQIFKKMQYVYGKNNQPLRQKTEQVYLYVEDSWNQILFARQEG